MNDLRIGEVAARAGVNLQTVRYYERRRLLPKPERTAGNYRSFTPDAVRRVRFIKRAQELGFTLKEIKVLLSLRAEPQAHCADVYQQAAAKVADIDKKLRGLRAMRKALGKLMAECSGRSPASDCPILEALEEDESARGARNENHNRRNPRSNHARQKVG
jgi:MerR family transcriptional regulator, copper efflux regulator